MMISDRIEAGKLLGEKLCKLQLVKPIVLAIPRGGIIVGDEIARKLNCKLDVVISKKITPPENPEFGIGAITYDGTIYQGESWDNYSNDSSFGDEITRKKNEVRRRLEEYRGNTEYILYRKNVVLVDDGIATGSTVFAILNWLANQEARKIVLAIPVMPASIYDKIKTKVSNIISLEVPTEFSAVGQFYKEFDQVSDQEVKKILENYKN